MRAVQPHTANGLDQTGLFFEGLGADESLTSAKRCEQMIHDIIVIVWVMLMLMLMLSLRMLIVMLMGFRVLIEVMMVGKVVVMVVVVVVQSRPAAAGNRGMIHPCPTVAR